jgi:hypothetical protein
MIRVYENPSVPDVVDANVCPRTISMAVTSAAMPQKARVGTSHLPLAGDWKLRGVYRASQTVVFIQVSVSVSSFGSDPC